MTKFNSNSSEKLRLERTCLKFVQDISQKPCAYNIENPSLLVETVRVWPATLVEVPARAVPEHVTNACT